MRRVIGPISEIITTLPLRNDGSADLAGPPYDLDPAVLEPADSEGSRREYSKCCIGLRPFTSRPKAHPTRHLDT